MRGERFDPNTFSLGGGGGKGAAVRPTGGGSGGAEGAMSRGGGGKQGAQAAYGDYPNYPEGRPLFWPESARYGNPPDLPSLLLQQRVIYVSMPVGFSVSRGDAGAASAWWRGARVCTRVCGDGGQGHESLRAAHTRRHSMSPVPAVPALRHGAAGGAVLLPGL